MKMWILRLCILALPFCPSFSEAQNFPLHQKATNSESSETLKQAPAPSKILEKLCAGEGVLALRDLALAYQKSFPEGRVARYESPMSIAAEWGLQVPYDSVSTLMNLGVRDLGIHHTPETNNFKIFLRDANGRLTEAQLQRPGKLLLESCSRSFGDSLDYTLNDPKETNSNSPELAATPQKCQCRVKPEISLSVTEVSVICESATSTCVCESVARSWLSPNLAKHHLQATCGKGKAFVAKTPLLGSFDPTRDKIETVVRAP